MLMRTIGDPITAALGGRLPADQLAQRIEEAGYNRPILVQYFEYIGQVFTGNFGETITVRWSTCSSVTAARRSSSPSTR